MRQFCPLRPVPIGNMTFHREYSRVRAGQRSNFREKTVERRKRARNDRVDLQLRCSESLNSRMQRLNISQSERAHCVTHKTDLFLV